MEVQLKGTKKQVEDAKKLLSERAKDFDDRISQIVNVPKKYLQGLIGSGGKFSYLRIQCHRLTCTQATTSVVS